MKLYLSFIYINVFLTRSHVAAFGIDEWSYGEGGDKTILLL